MTAAARFHDRAGTYQASTGQWHTDCACRWVSPPAADMRAAHQAHQTHVEVIKRGGVVTGRPPGGYENRTMVEIAADRRVLAEARTVADCMDMILSDGAWDQCPWCDGVESVNDDAELVFGFHNPAGCELADLLASLRKEPPS